ncbi:hypothetical protein ENT52713_15600 [Enterobacter sp. 200527-13]|nr:hypothetical protein ENT52713_15600 [Enterobacter sp. 200527-13]
MNLTFSAKCIGVLKYFCKQMIGDMNIDQADMLNSRMPTAMPPGCPKAKYLLKKVL